MNIRVYKVIFPNGTICFELKTEDKRGASAFASISALVSYIKPTIKEYLQNNGRFSQVTVDPIPFHEFEMNSNLQSQSNEPLSKTEVQEFWTLYNT